jgi:hypothetical protein
MTALVKHVDGWSVTMDGDEPTILDEQLGERLGFSRPRKIRELIERMQKEGALENSEIQSVPSRAGSFGGRPGTSYRLTESGVLKVTARSRAKLDRTDDLYIIESSCGWFKIGRSADVSARLKSLEWQSPPSVTLEVIAIAHGLGCEEHALHDAFAEFRERGEWFSPRAGVAIRKAISIGIDAFVGHLADKPTERKRSALPIDTKRLARVLAVRRRMGRRHKPIPGPERRLALVPASTQGVLPFPGAPA